MKTLTSRSRTAILACLYVLFAGIMSAQESSENASDEKSSPAKPAKITVEPAKLNLKVGETAKLKATVLDAEGKTVEVPLGFFSRSRGVVVEPNGTVTARQPGDHRVTVMTRTRIRENRKSVNVSVSVAKPELDHIEFQHGLEKIYASTTVSIPARVVDKTAAERGDVAVAYATSDASVAEIDAFGNLTAHRAGEVTITAKGDKLQATSTLKVVVNPVRRLTLQSSDSENARTGDVIPFSAVARDGLGRPVADAPVYYSCFRRYGEQSRSSAAACQIDQTGRFVAEQPGMYTIVATSGNKSVQETVSVAPRNVQRRIQLVGHAPVRDVHSSDLWVWEGVDGRDYCVTGTWGGNGEALFWDVTDPKDMKKIGSHKVDARTVNDVKVSEDGRICVISREGASNRKNGIVILDVEDPHNIKQLAAFDDELTGGVHNVFIDNSYVYAINNGRRYDVIDIHDPTQPRRVGRYELTLPGHGVHDVWIVDGIAYSSNWGYGIHMVDVGNGIAGGTPENPQPIDSYPYPKTASHAAFPYFSQSTGRFYVIGGDERFPNGMSTRNKPTIAGGYIHFVDMTTPGKAQETARYEIPEAGSHNFWIDGDLLYLAYYNAGLRVVDISGDLMGNLYNQGREIGHFRPFDVKGVIPNAAMTWGPQPHKGTIFMTDWNSGLWAVKLGP